MKRAACVVLWGALILISPPIATACVGGLTLVAVFLLAAGY